MDVGAFSQCRAGRCVIMMKVRLEEFGPGEVVVVFTRLGNWSSINQ